MKLSFDKWLAERNKLYSMMELFSKELQQFPKSDMGLVPDHIRITDTYKKAKLNYDQAFHMVRYINSVAPKEWLRKARKPKAQGAL